MNYNNKKFRAIQNSENGEIAEQTIFLYQQNGNILTSSYKGGKIMEGHLIGLVDEKGIITMSYHQINQEGIIMTGTCVSTPEILKNGKVRLSEKWQWTSGNQSKGQSIIEEI